MEEVGYYNNSDSSGIKAIIIPWSDASVDLELLFSSIPTDVSKIIFIGKPSKENENSSLSEFNSSSLDHENIFLKSFKDTGYNYADKVVFENHKKEVEYFLSSNEILGSISDKIIHINPNASIPFGVGASLGLMWCKMSGADAVIILNPKSKISANSFDKVFEQIVEEGKDVVLGRNENKIRRFVKSLNYVLKTILLNFASGYWFSTFIYTSCLGVSKEAISRIPIKNLKPTYGFLMDFLIKANMNNCKLVEVFVDDKESSKTLLNKGLLFVSLKILLFGFAKRLWVKYFFRDFHPLFLFYHLSFLLFIVAGFYSWKVIYVITQTGRELNKMTVFALIFFLISAVQAFAFSTWMDISDNKKNI